jgi:hypothetical protein
MWICGKMNKISWVERKTNEIVLQEVREKRNIMSHILKKKTKLIGHLIRHNTFINNIFKGKVMERRGRGRPRTPRSDAADEHKLIFTTKEPSNQQGDMATLQGAAFR